VAELTTLARPYARAAFEYAKNVKQLSNWMHMLQLMTQITKDNKIKNLIATPKFSNLEKAETLLNFFGDELDEKFINFVKLLADKKRLFLLPQIFSLFVLYQNKLENKVKVKVISAFALTQAQQKKINASLKKRFNQEIDLTLEQDKTLIGGLVIKAENLIIDGSIRNKLAKLAETLKSNF